MFNYLFLSLSFLFTFFIPGFLVIETFFSNLPKIQKLPLYLILSVLISTHLVYIVSLFLGYSRFSIFLAFLLFLPWIVAYLHKAEIKMDMPKVHVSAIALSLGIFILFLVALYPAIFFRHQDYFVMSADNWQDTPMHLGIIQSISQGNFPPQAPYFSGHPLIYHYFTDFHTAILSTLVDTFMPRILILDNAFFVFAFSLAIYALGYYLTGSQRASLFAAFLGVFNGSFMFVRFLRDIAGVLGTPEAITQIKELLASGAYTMEFGKLMQLTPMADYFLQNRPMMVGLPAVVLASHLIFRGCREEEGKNLLLAGLIVGMLGKFSSFGLGVSGLVAILAYFLFWRTKDFKKHSVRFLLFLVPIFFFSAITLTTPQGGRSLPSMILDGLAFGPWHKTKDIFWYLQFYFANFGIPFLIAASVFVRLVIKRGVEKTDLFLSSWLALMFGIPHLLRFTIFEFDMLKFFYFMMIPVAIMAGAFLSKIWQARVGPLLVTLVLVVSSLTSLLTLGASFLNKNFAYSLDDYYAGLWIRENTPANSVFITLPTVHSAVSDIGGRLRVLSYINWPYSHGYNVGEDNVFSRRDDLEDLYQSDNAGRVLQTMQKYKAQYIFYGHQEKENYPSAEFLFDNVDYLQKAYSSDAIKIYEIKI